MRFRSLGFRVNRIRVLGFWGLGFRVDGIKDSGLGFRDLGFGD